MHSIDQVVGGNKKSQRALRKKFEGNFKDQTPREKWAFEVRKTPEVLEMIELANRETNRLRERYGLPERNIPSENYHVVKRKAPGAPSHFFFDLESQAVVVVELAMKSQMFEALFHETVHFQSFSSINAEDGSLRRLGLGVAAGEAGEGHFLPLNEVITQELTKRFIRRQQRSSFLRGDFEKLEEARAYHGVDAMDDIVAVCVWDFVPEDLSLKFERLPFAYGVERQALHLLLEKLQERNPQSFRDQNEWFDLFASAMFNGHLLELARAIEKTFGQGKFRELGEQKTGEELPAFVKAL